MQLDPLQKDIQLLFEYIIKNTEFLKRRIQVCKKIPAKRKIIKVEYILNQAKLILKKYPSNRKKIIPKPPALSYQEKNENQTENGFLNQHIEDKREKPSGRKSILFITLVQLN